MRLTWEGRKRSRRARGEEGGYKEREMEGGRGEKSKGSKEGKGRGTELAGEKGEKPRKG